MKILGYSEGYHDAAVTVIENGKILYASHAERYSKKKNDKHQPLKKTTTHKKRKKQKQKKTRRIIIRLTGEKTIIKQKTRRNKTIKPNKKHIIKKQNHVFALIKNENENKNKKR